MIMQQKDMTQNAEFLVFNSVLGSNLLLESGANLVLLGYRESSLGSGHL